MPTGERARCSPAALGIAMALVACLAAGIAAAQAEHATERSKRPAWQWSLEERLAARFESEGMKARAAEAAAGRQQVAAQFGETGDASEDQHSIDGRREPELFLPTELFRSFINRAFPEDGEGQAYARRRLEAGAAALGFGSDLWIRLEKAAAPYLSARDERYRRAMAALAVSEEPENPADDDLAHCRALAQSLAAAKAEFGAEALLRLLYQEVAPTLSITYNFDDETIGRLRSLEGGCK